MHGDSEYRKHESREPIENTISFNAGYPSIVDDCFQQTTAFPSSPHWARRKGGKAHKALNKSLRC